MPIPISLLVDDGAPINPMFFHDPPCKHSLLMPNSLLRDFADLCCDYGVKGKFSVLPMPCCLGGIDGELNHVPQRHLREFLKIVRNKIAPHFDISPEILTHLAVYRMVEGGFAHMYEDEWLARATLDEMTDYISLALEILDHVGLPATGVTSPWSAGEKNEDQYAQAIGKAQWRVHQRAVSWYFLHVLSKGPVHGPSIHYRDPSTGHVVVSIPAMTDDPFWDTQRPASNSRQTARTAARSAVDALLSPDGTSGRIPEVVAGRCPITILTHWPSLYSDGTYAGLWGLEQLLARIKKVYGDNLKWVTCNELAISTWETCNAGPNHGDACGNPAPSCGNDCSHA